MSPKLRDPVVAVIFAVRVVRTPVWVTEPAEIATRESPDVAVTPCREIDPALAVIVVVDAAAALTAPVTVIEPAVEIRLILVVVLTAPMLILPPVDVMVWRVSALVTTAP